jgi:hypothetical protein
MDIGLWARVMWRFKWVTVTGFVLACFLAVLSTARISFAGGSLKLAYRDPVIYSAQARMLVTQAGFPWGRVVLPGQTAAEGGAASSASTGTTSDSSNYADPSRFSDLAAFYAALVNGDQIQHQVVHPRLHELLAAQAEADPQGNGTLPIVDFTSQATSPASAIRIAEAGMASLQDFVADQQKQAGISPNQRVLLESLEVPAKATVAVPHKKTVPIVAFMTVLLATLGLVLALENLRPRPRLRDVALTPVDGDADDVRSEPTSRRPTAQTS